MGRPRLLLPLLLAACAASPPETKTYGRLRVYQMYPGPRRPLRQLAVLTVITPGGEDGLVVVGGITDVERGKEFRPDLELDLVELPPGRYRLELWYWIARSAFEATPEGERALRIESLRSAEVAMLDVHLEAGRSYTIRPELALRAGVPPGERDRYAALVYAANMTRVSDPPPAEKVVAEWVWRPHLQPLPGQFRDYR